MTDFVSGVMVGQSVMVLLWAFAAPMLVWRQAYLERKESERKFQELIDQIKKENNDAERTN